MQAEADLAQAKAAAEDLQQQLGVVQARLAAAEAANTSLAADDATVHAQAAAQAGQLAELQQQLAGAAREKEQLQQQLAAAAAEHRSAHAALAAELEQLRVQLSAAQEAAASSKVSNGGRASAHGSSTVPTRACLLFVEPPKVGHRHATAFPLCVRSRS